MAGFTAGGGKMSLDTEGGFGSLTMWPHTRSPGLPRGPAEEQASGSFTWPSTVPTF